MGILKKIEQIRKTPINPHMITAYAPGELPLFVKEGVLYNNTYNSPQHEAEQGNIRAIRSFFRHLLPDPREREVLLDFIAYNLTYPGKKIRWIPVLESNSQGRALLCCYLLNMLLGDDNVVFISDDNVRFNENDEWKTDFKLVFLLESSVENYFFEKRRITARLKEFIVDKEIEIEKRGSSLTLTNTTNLIAFTKRAVKKNDLIHTMKCSTEVKPPKYGASLLHFMAYNLPAIVWFFQTRDLKRFDPQIPSRF